jgi:hypothetical protein
MAAPGGRVALSVAVHVLCTLTLGSVVFWAVVAPRFQRGVAASLPRLLVPALLQDAQAVTVAQLGAPELLRSRAWYVYDAGAMPLVRAANTNLRVLCVAAAVAATALVLLVWAHSGLSAAEGGVEVLCALAVYLIAVAVEVAFILLVAVKYKPISPSAFARAVLARIATRCFGGR